MNLSKKYFLSWIFRTKAIGARNRGCSSYPERKPCRQGRHSVSGETTRTSAVFKPQSRSQEGDQRPERTTRGVRFVLFCGSRGYSSNERMAGRDRKRPFQHGRLRGAADGQFHESDWTDQEVGFALARRVPIMAVRLGRDPYGFIGRFQGLSATWDNCVLEIAKLLIRHDRMFAAYVRALRRCPTWNTGKHAGRGVARYREPY